MLGKYLNYNTNDIFIIFSLSTFLGCFFVFNFVKVNFEFLKKKESKNLNRDKVD